MLAQNLLAKCKVATRQHTKGLEKTEAEAYLVLRLHRSLSIPTVERTTRRSAFVRIGQVEEERIPKAIFQALRYPATKRLLQTNRGTK